MEYTLRYDADNLSNVYTLPVLTDVVVVRYSKTPLELSVDVRNEG